MSMVNPNQLWSAIIVDQLAYLDIEYVVIGAGSRSTPLTLAFTTDDRFTCYSQVDERSAAFFALGIAKSTSTPVVLVCTSGTAAANFYPAIIEAKSSSIPLLVCTADRPPELRISGANQTTDQIKLYGDQVNWFCDVGLPEDDLDSRLIGYLQSVATQAVEKSTYPIAGPVHLNFPFRKPLEPTVATDNTVSPKEIVSNLELVRNELTTGEIRPTGEQIERFTGLIEDSDKIMIICGPNARRDVPLDTLQQVVDSLNAAALVDALSGYRYGCDNKRFITSYESFLQIQTDNTLLEPDLILHIGDMPISKYLTQWLTSSKATWVLLNHRVENTDGIHGSSVWFRTSPNHLLQQVKETKVVEDDFIQSWSTVDRSTVEYLADLKSQYPSFEPNIIANILDHLPASHLFIANSLAVRHFDQFIHNTEEEFKVHSNRGVSGIDGTLSSALGIAVSISEPVVLITGDLAFYHDINGLLAMMRYGIPLHIIVINNQGGAIFDRLPIREYEPPFDEFFLTRHQLNFDKIAVQYDIEHILVDDVKQLPEAIAPFLSSSQGILEIVVNPSDMEKIRREIMISLHEQLSQD